MNKRLFATLFFSLLVGASAMASAPEQSAQSLQAAFSETERTSFSEKERTLLKNYAAATWKSFVKLANPKTGLPADNAYLDADGQTQYETYTSPTNIGVYLWSILAARDLQLIAPSEARARAAKTLASLAKLERSHGQFYNWYDSATLRSTVACPFLSSVDNGWLAAALMMVSHAMPDLGTEAKAILRDMDFGFYYNPDVGLLHGGYWPATAGCVNEGFTPHHYDILNTEPRIASYIGIANGDIPKTHYFKLWRTFPNTCDWAWQEMKPNGRKRTYLGVTVFEGGYRYHPTENPYTEQVPYLRILPSWGGSMFEALMVPLLVPEDQWGPKSWGINHPLYVKAQIQHGLSDAQYGFWGFSPTTDPSSPTGNYAIYGVDALGMWDTGYASNNDQTLMDYGFGSCPNRSPLPLPLPSDYANGVVNPSAAFLALRFAPQAALKNLANLRRAFPSVWDKGWGFWSSVNAQTGQVSYRVLALDQGMAMAALGNALTTNNLQRYFTEGAVQAVIRPLLAKEVFTVGEIAPSHCP